MKIRAMLFDIYGTILCEGDEENAMPVRLGFVRLALICRQHAVLVYSVSDADLTNLKLDLDAVLVRDGHDHRIFDGFFRLKDKPKDYRHVCESLGLNSHQILVVGDREEVDLIGASRIGCRTFLAPPYASVSDNFDLSVLAGYL